MKPLTVEQIAGSWDGPWRVEGPWHHKSGYPKTWNVTNSWRSLCDCPTRYGADLIVAALNASPLVDEDGAA